MSSRALNNPLNFSKAEKRVVDLLLQGHSLKEMADILQISKQGVQWHLTRIYKAHNVRNALGLVLLLWGLGYERPGLVKRATDGLPNLDTNLPGGFHA